MRRHADAETLAAFREELLSRRKAARVSAHLAACSRCAGLDAQLTEVSALLTQSTAPPMPDALTSRIEAAIAAEAATRAAAAADGTVAAAGAGAHAQDGAARPSAQRAGPAARPPTGPRRSILALRVAAVTAAVVVVAGGGYGAAKLLSESSSHGTAASKAAPAISATGAPRVPAGGVGAPAAASNSGSGGTVPAARIVSSGTNYQPGQLKSQVSVTLTTAGGNTAETPGPAPTRRSASPFQPWPACVARLAGGTRALLVDHARYQGRPATVIVVPSGQPGTLRVLVVAGDCTTRTSHVLATTALPGSG